MENNNKKLFTLGDKIQWIVIIILVLWGVYAWAVRNTKRSLIPLTSQEMRDESANCFKWTGKDCQPYSAD
jgi:hypothetical protein